MVICVSYCIPRYALLYGTMARYHCLTMYYDPPGFGHLAIAVQWGNPLSPDRADGTIGTLPQCVRSSALTTIDFTIV